MYSKFQLLKKYCRYFVTASNSKGHGIHSPFVFDFTTKVLNDKLQCDFFQRTEDLRRRLKADERLLRIQDFGAGSRVDDHQERKVSSIAFSALKPKKYSQLLFRIVRYYFSHKTTEGPVNLLELGTSLGLTSAYLAAAVKNANVVTMEGSAAVADVARENFQSLGIANVRIIEGNFDETLPIYISEITTGNQGLIDFAFIDGNHRMAPTLQYFKQLLPAIHEHSILVFDDIHWSEEMESAWEKIKADPAVTLTIDLFFIGLVFFRKEQKVKQHFTIRY